MTDKKLSLLVSQIDRYLSLGRDLIPLYPKTKIPYSGWTTDKYPAELLRRHVDKKGCNLAWRLGPLDLVIDVDPRHLGAAESIAELTGELIDPGEHPLVHSGGADRGQHYYCKLPRIVKVKKEVAAFKGIDFLSQGHFVLIPGCIHPETKRLYRADPFAPDVAPVICEDLLAAIRRNENPHQYASDPDDLIPLNEIEYHLKSIPAEDYQDYHEWLKIGMAIHAASGGDVEAEELWVNWCTSDPDYADQEDGARAKWASFADRADGVTAATLVRAAMLSGSSPNGVSAEELFFGTPVIEAPSCQGVESFIAGLKDRDPARLSDAVTRAQRYGLDHWDDVKRALKANYKTTMGTIDRIVREIERKAKAKERRLQREALQQFQDDAAIAVADKVLADQFEGGRLLVHAMNQAFYHYRVTHWEPLAANIVKQHLLDAAQEYRAADDNDLTFRPSTLFASAESVLVARTAQSDDVFRFEETPPAVINTANAEVWIGTEGEVTAKPHSPESYLLSCIDTAYDPRAECPRMDQALEQIFRDNQEPDEMIRHVWEFAGYAIQPRKNIPSWWLWWGDGSNGKSIVSKVIMGLLGKKAVLPRPVEAFADSGRNAHALASLVGKLLVVDDDAETTTNLPESALKKLAENNPFEANPKNREAFSFVSCATALILVNSWPRVKDLSHGMRRKAYVVPWGRRFADEEMDLDLKDRILEHELPGVLNRALEGYRRLRRRGRFDEPTECLRAKNDWLKVANPLIEFVHGHVTKTGNGTHVALAELYLDYKVWCHMDGGVRSPLSQNRFSVALQQLDYAVDDNNLIQGIERLEN